VLERPGTAVFFFCEMGRSDLVRTTIPGRAERGLLKIVGRAFRHEFAAIAILLVATFLCISSAQTVPSDGSAQARTSNPENQQANDEALQELRRRYDTLNAATASGNPEAVSQASQRLSALALREMGSLRMLVGAYPQAMELYRRSIEWEDLPESRMQLAVAALRSGKPQQAIAEAKRVLEASPKDAQVWFLKGKAEMAAEDYHAAVESLQHSLQLAKNVNAEYALGYSFLKLGQKADAEKIFQRMVAEYGDRAIWHVVFAGAYRESKMPDDAIREFRKAIAMDPKVGHAYFFLGLTLLEQNHWAQTEDSMTAFRAAVQVDPKDYFSNFYLGVGESELKLFEESNQHLKVAAESQPDSPEIFLYMGLNAFQQSDYKPAKEYLLNAVALTGSDQARNNFQIRRAYIALGRIEFIAGNRAESEKYIQLAREMSNRSLENSAQSISETMSSGMRHAPETLPYIKVPNPTVLADMAAPTDAAAPMDAAMLAHAPLNEAEQAQAKQFETQLRQILSNSLNDWGASEARRGQYQTALGHFHEAERWDNSSGGLMRNTGIAALKLEDIPEAIRALGVAVRLDPQDKLARSRLAITLFRTDQYPEANEQFEALGKDSFRDPDLTYAWGYTLVKQNRPQKAGEVLSRATVLATSASMLVSIGDLYSVLEDYEHAVGAYKKALGVDPVIPKCRYKMGAALLRLDRPQEAIAPLEDELKASPDDADVKYNLAYALLQTSQKERAVLMLQELAAAHPEHAQAQYQMGKTLLEDGHVPEAVQHLEIAAKLDPDRDYIHYQLQSAYRRNGQKADADRELELYREMKAKKREKAVIAMPVQSK
jgi:tetratricopeptide (TPR) repeat protein